MLVAMRAQADAAARAIRSADALLVTAGAGMGVDSGLPDFRGNEGFWRAYPPYAKLGLSFAELANPRWFATDPCFAWGFYGHRMDLYRRTVPHAGFAVLRSLGERLEHGVRVFTSNVDGQFQRAGFAERAITECHGALDFVQCTRGCGLGVVRYEGDAPDVDAESFRASEPLPHCERCGALLRPNVLMFGDASWDASRTEAQERSLEHWLAELRARGARLVVIECGAGSAIPTVRMLGERLVRSTGATLVRLNPREAEVPRGQVSLASGALEGLRAIEAALGTPG
jgi:NAD-dependent SIR2 family protein deacetylase